MEKSGQFSFETARLAKQTREKRPRLLALMSEYHHHNHTQRTEYPFYLSVVQVKANISPSRERRSLPLQAAETPLQSLLQLVGARPRATGDHLTSTRATLAHEHGIVAALTPTFPAVAALGHHLVDATAVAMADRLRATRAGSSLGSLALPIDGEAGLAFAFEVVGVVFLKGNTGSAFYLV